MGTFDSGTKRESKFQKPNFALHLSDGKGLMRLSFSSSLSKTRTLEAERRRLQGQKLALLEKAAGAGGL